MTLCYVNGEICAPEDAKISVFDKSYQFGEGLFETFRSYNGKFPFLEDHIGRMTWSSEYLNIGFDLPKLEWICSEMLEKEGYQDGRFKLIVSEHKSGTNHVIVCDEIDPKKLEGTYKLKSLQQIRNDGYPLATFKSTNYLTKMLGLKEAMDSGFDDGILLNHKDQVTETTTGNIFWVTPKGELRHILKDCLHLPGVTQQSLLKVLDTNKIHHKEEIISLKELSHAREIFITNSIVGVKPVTSVDGLKISGGEPGDITLMIKSLWNKNIETLTKDS